MGDDARRGLVDASGLHFDLLQHGDLGVVNFVVSNDDGVHNEVRCLGSVVVVKASIERDMCLLDRVNLSAAEGVRRGIRLAATKRKERMLMCSEHKSQQLIL